MATAVASAPTWVQQLNVPTKNEVRYSMVAHIVLAYLKSGDWFRIGEDPYCQPPVRRMMEEKLFIDLTRLCVPTIVQNLKTEKWELKVAGLERYRESIAEFFMYYKANPKCPWKVPMEQQHHFVSQFKEVVLPSLGEAELQTLRQTVLDGEHRLLLQLLLVASNLAKPSMDLLNTVIFRSTHKGEISAALGGLSGRRVYLLFLGNALKTHFVQKRYEIFNALMEIAYNHVNIRDYLEIILYSVEAAIKEGSFKSKAIPSLNLIFNHPCIGPEWRTHLTQLYSKIESARQSPAAERKVSEV